MVFSVKNRTKGELLKWARGKGRVMEGSVDLEKPSVKALGEAGVCHVNERCQSGKRVILPAPHA